MRILASADLHGDHALYEWLIGVAADRAPDVVVLAGDLLGAPDHYETIEESQRADAAAITYILQRVKPPIFYIMGNDDMVELDPKSNNIQTIHQNRIDMGEVNFVGYQYSLPFMGGVYEKQEADIADDLSALEAVIDNRTVFVTHSPAFGILDTGILNVSAGSVSIKRLIERHNPLLHIHGHIHEEFGIQGRHFNVAAAGRPRAALIDTDTMESQLIDETTS